MGMYLFVKSPQGIKRKKKSPQGIRDLRHRVLVFLSAMFWQPIPACDFPRQKAVVFSSEGWPYLHVFSTVKSPQGIRDLRHRVLVFLSAMFWQPIPACDFSRQKAVVFSSEGWPYLHVFSTVKSPQGIRDLRHRVLVFL